MNPEDYEAIQIKAQAQAQEEAYKKDRTMAGPPHDGWRDVDWEEMKETFQTYTDRPQNHYSTGGVEAIDLIEAYNLNFLEGCVVKYVARWRKKDGVNDLKKAKWYIDRLIRAAEGE